MPNYKKLEFCRELAYMMGIIDILSLPVPNLKNDWDTKRDMIDPLRNNLTFIWVMGDFVMPTIVGDRLEPLLRFIPVHAGSGIMEHSIFSTQQYLNVPRRHISSLSMYMQDMLGAKKLDIRDPIALTLHFRTV